MGELKNGLDKTWTGRPEKQGLYDPRFEHDACGIGMLVQIKGLASHDLIVKGLDVLCNLRHRGAIGADPKGGDGAGMMIQIPHAFFSEECAKLGIELGAAGSYGIAQIFFPADPGAAEQLRDLAEQIVKKSDLKFLGWRDVPVDAPKADLGESVVRTQPVIKQLFVASRGAKGKYFERRLYVMRKRLEKAAQESGLGPNRRFYIVSFSSRTIVYKGMFMSYQLQPYFPDLSDPRVASAIVLVHQRYSTNTFPDWPLAHPFRMIAHNGEINTLRGNVNRMKSAEAHFESELFGDDVKYLAPVIDETASDTACLDNAVELLYFSGRSLPHAVMMCIPEAWESKSNLPDDYRGFFEYHETLMQPWDGPAALAFTDGIVAGAILDRNGLRPARYQITDDDIFFLASEAGTIEYPPERIVAKGRLEPGKMVLVDTEKGEFLQDREIKQQIIDQRPYAAWLKKNKIELKDLKISAVERQPDHATLRHRQQAFGYTAEDLKYILTPMATYGEEPIGSMGNDAPLAVFSERSPLLYSYFKQMFAQVTNPPIDPIREELVMNLSTYIGSWLNLMAETPEHCRMIKIPQPILTNLELEQIRHVGEQGFKAFTLPILWDVSDGPAGMTRDLHALFAAADRAIADGYNILVLSDRGVDATHAAIPSLLAVAGLNHHLIRSRTRNLVGFVIETGEAREVHHMATLMGFGCSAINPYLAMETIRDMAANQLLPMGRTLDDYPQDAVEMAEKHFIKACGKGLYKIMSKMGISTMMSYRGAQIFEIIGLDQDVVDSCFTGTHSRINGVGLEQIAIEALFRHRLAYGDQRPATTRLKRGGEHAWRRESDVHMWNPQTIALLQHSVRAKNYQVFKKFTAAADGAARQATLRGLFKFKPGNAIPVDRVAGADHITARFCTGAMSLGSISREVHETLAIAMNRIGGKSNTGEGGEDPARYGTERNSAIKQVASARFGVTSHYLVSAKELQIKIAQGAKPGEGGQLPGHKVSDYIGWLRFSVPGVTLISPPPHHDIYSIEDLAQLIFDLKNGNPGARIAVKLVSETGVGTVAAGVVKAHADVVVIAGHDGGTGASPVSSIKHAGAPWELGLAETQQTLVLNGLRSRVRLQTDGQLKTGRDVVIAAMLGAEEFGFATSALVTQGCILMRKCHLNTCPVGIATQDEFLRKKFDGRAEYLITFFEFIAQEVREILAAIGFRSIDDIIGRVDLLDIEDVHTHPKLGRLDLSPILHQPEPPGARPQRLCVEGQDHGIDDVLDKKIIAMATTALAGNGNVEFDIAVRNSDRSVGAMLSAEVSRQHGRDGLPPDSIVVNFSGTAGQSFGCWLARGVSFHLRGEANDYVGKGLSGGKITIVPPAQAVYEWHKNLIAGNTVLYGATSGEAYIAGVAGERFAVRNSGAYAVVEGVGDHGCEYMTGGRVVVLGETGRNFAAGMSGGIAYVYDDTHKFGRLCNLGMVDLEQIAEDADRETIREMVEKHFQHTRSKRARQILNRWAESAGKFVKVMPREYRRVLMQRGAAAVRA